MIGVYKVNGLTEKRISFYSYGSPDSIKVYDSLNVIAFYCPTRIVGDPWLTDTIAPLRVIEQLRDYEIDSERWKESSATIALSDSLSENFVQEP